MIMPLTLSLHSFFDFHFFLFADGANDREGVGVSAKLSIGHREHQRSCSSEEELASINSCDNRLSSLTLGSGSEVGEGEYNGPFEGRAVALVDCIPSPYDRHALRFKVIIFYVRTKCFYIEANPFLWILYEIVQEIVLPRLFSTQCVLLHCHYIFHVLFFALIIKPFGTAVNRPLKASRDFSPRNQKYSPFFMISYCPFDVPLYQ